MSEKSGAIDVLMANIRDRDEQINALRMERDALLGRVEEVAAFIRQQADHPGDDGIVKLFPEHLYAWADALEGEGDG